VAVNCAGKEIARQQEIATRGLRSAARLLYLACVCHAGALLLRTSSGDWPVRQALQRFRLRLQARWRSWQPTGAVRLPRPDSSVVERGPEKAGVGGSIPSLAIIPTACDARDALRSPRGLAHVSPDQGRRQARCARFERARRLWQASQDGVVPAPDPSSAVTGNGVSALARCPRHPLCWVVFVSAHCLVRFEAG